ncbi:putative GNAT superfamily acetyltransferase [Allocatelliglobosispora scoriae]|uniref:Putative GNAT superfamily acetyltransferase n=1 Tax=Allocatelliglobosispora scoriae TaxID=643052 RepID=A0A841C1S3_9ACTN|nr:GNAT family N-acetyltransferase [Allocatelliglobosispora scoriae]MBB5872920.1 putative GNAT superfamily acetyltransferase [Allocatelliglobosispora scoriae]
MDVTDEAEAVARTIAGRLGLRVVELHSIGDCIAAGELVRQVWDAASADSVVNASTMRAFAHSGNYVAGAYAGDLLVGVAVAFRGDGHLHSHVAGVLPGHQGGGVGHALKQHQRGWSLRHGIDRVAWTFDPLIRRNAVFNLRKLGADATEYLPDFYGPLDDGVNAGDVTDRLYIEWHLDSPAAIGAARGTPADADPAGAATLLADADDRPVPGSAAPDGGPLLIAVPRDIEALRTRDPHLAAAWRVALREAVTSTLTRGYAISGITRTGSYLLRHPEHQEVPR